MTLEAIEPNGYVLVATLAEILSRPDDGPVGLARVARYAGVEPHAGATDTVVHLSLIHI